MVALNDGHTSFLHDSFALTLGAHLTDSGSGGSNKSEPLALNKLHEVSILWQEAISNKVIIKVRKLS